MQIKKSKGEHVHCYVKAIPLLRERDGEHVKVFGDSDMGVETCDSIASAQFLSEWNGLERDQKFC